MTTFRAAPDQVSTDDLPRPDATATTAQSGDLPRPIPAIMDSGRIKFGASCRNPLQK